MTLPVPPGRSLELTETPGTRGSVVQLTGSGSIDFDDVDLNGVGHTATVTVTFAAPYAAEVRLHVVWFVRKDVVFKPGRIEFGSIPENAGVEKAYAGACLGD